MTHYEYDFQRVKFSLFGAGRAEDAYRKMIRTRAKEGWRLVQIFSPAIGTHGHAKFYEMIFEREKPTPGES